MNRNITRGLALAALTGGFTILGATAANAIDLPDLGGGNSGTGLLGNGGLLGTGIDLGGSSTGTGGVLDDLLVDLPVNVDNLNVGILPSNGGGLLGGDLLGGSDGLSLGDGILVDTGATNADILADLGIDTSDLVGDNDQLNAIVGVPLDASNTWVSILGNEPNGIVVVPNVDGGVSTVTDGVLDGIVDVPIDVSCTSVTVLSDYENECAATTPGDSDGGLLGGDLLGGDVLNGDLPVNVDDLSLDVLDGDVLGDGLSFGDDGVLVDLGDTGTGLGTDLGVGDALGAFVGAPVDLSDAWVSILGADRNGVVIVPDLTIDLSVLTGGLITSEILAPISLECVTITILSDYERDCGSSTIDDTPTDPEDPTTPTTPVVPGGDNGDVNNGGTNDTEGITDPCAVVPTVATTELTSAQPINLAVFGAAALAGAVAAMLLMLLGRRLGRQQQ